MTESRIAPCPSGPCTQDTFRVYEALEAGAIPIVDARTPKASEYDGYWTYIFKEDPPFPVIYEWSALQDITDNLLDNWQNKSNQVFSWWQRQKRIVAYNLRDDLIKLGMLEEREQALKDKITVVVPSSSIPSHPNTSILEETISSIRAHLPDSEILITFDGLREEHAYRADIYEEYKRNVLFLCNFKWHNVLPIIFEEHMHQSGMLRSILPTVKTKTLLYVEQDTPLTPDCEIDFTDMVDIIESGQANTIRLHHEALIIPEHTHLMLDKEPMEVSGVPLVRTMQWSQRPHLMSTVAYRSVMDTYFSENSRCFIEDKLHGQVQSDCNIDGDMGWFKWRLFIYHPEGSIKRSYHLDGRAGEDKLDGTQVF